MRAGVVPVARVCGDSGHCGQWPGGAVADGGGRRLDRHHRRGRGRDAMTRRQRALDDLLADLDDRVWAGDCRAHPDGVVRLCAVAADIVPVRLGLTKGDLYTLWAPRWRDAGGEWEG